MDSKVKNYRRTYTEAKQGFDPDFSYMVFERQTADGGKKDYSVIDNILAGLVIGPAEIEICMDDTKGKNLLIVKATPDDIDIIVNAFVDQNLHDNFNYCIYGAFDA